MLQLNEATGEWEEYPYQFYASTVTDNPEVYVLFSDEMNGKYVVEVASADQGIIEYEAIMTGGPQEHRGKYIDFYAENAEGRQVLADIDGVTKDTPIYAKLEYRPGKLFTLTFFDPFSGAIAEVRDGSYEVTFDNVSSSSRVSFSYNSKDFVFDEFIHPSSMMGSGAYDSPSLSIFSNCRVMQREFGSSSSRACLIDSNGVESCEAYWFYKYSEYLLLLNS